MQTNKQSQDGWNNPSLDSMSIASRARILSTLLASRYMPRVYWQDKAKCIGTSISVFYGVGDEQMLSADVKFAKVICQSCAVQRDCLVTSLLHQEEWGIWGGFAAHERRTALARNNNNINAVMEEFEAGTLVRPRKRKKKSDGTKKTEN